ncbi:MAG: class I SAM-dependent methyltransferase [Rhizobiaceae bacterium]
MTDHGWRTLFHPFESAALDAPGAGERVLFLGGQPGFRLPDGFAAALTIVQGFRPWFLALGKSGHAVTATPEGDGYDTALVQVGRHRGFNELQVAEAIARVRPGGLIVVSGGKEDGIASLRKRVGELLTIDGHLSKHHGVAFWLTPPEAFGDAVAALRESNPPTLVEGRFHTAPGMFSHDRVDAGSRLLAQHLPAGIAGAVADFCAGWGYLSAELLARCPDIETLDLYEAEHAASEAARRNVGDPRAEAFWHDLIGEPVGRRYDWIVMNPPFHQTRAADPGIGERLIRAASQALVKGGRLVMVANQQLPYEATLKGAFADMREIVRAGGYKVIVARR